MAKISWINVTACVFVIVWGSLFLSVLIPSESPNIRSGDASNSADSLGVGSHIDAAVGRRISDPENEMIEPKRYKTTEIRYDPAPLEEVRKNMTLYLHTLHASLSAMAGPSVNAETVWESFLDITKSMPMAWDDQNKHRIPMPKTDGSIFVSVGTYRDPYCPMTLKSLFSQAKNPEKLYIGLLQQNCFHPPCRTGVLVGGKVDVMGADVDCYLEFCKSPEGQRSGACNTGQVRLFNVNESESLGPYMARYLGAKFYQ